MTQNPATEDKHYPTNDEIVVDKLENVSGGRLRDAETAIVSKEPSVVRAKVPAATGWADVPY